MKALVCNLTMFILILTVANPEEIYARRIRQVHKIETSGMASGHQQYERYGHIRIEAHDTCSLATHAGEIAFAADSVKFAGYDKPLMASKETFHVINRSGTGIKKVGIRITYLDLKNRMLHSRDIEVECMVPENETRIAAIPTWDIQHTFFYHLSPRPRKTATPYKVAIRLLWVEI